MVGFLWEVLILMYMFGFGLVLGLLFKLLVVKFLSVVVCVFLLDWVFVVIFEFFEIFLKNSYFGFLVSKCDDVVKFYFFWSFIILLSIWCYFFFMLYGSLNVSFWILFGWLNLDEYWLFFIVFLLFMRKMVVLFFILFLFYGWLI